MWLNHWTSSIHGNWRSPGYNKTFASFVPTRVAQVAIVGRPYENEHSLEVELQSSRRLSIERSKARLNCHMGPRSQQRRGQSLRSAVFAAHHAKTAKAECQEKCGTGFGDTTERELPPVTARTPLPAEPRNPSTSGY